MLLFPAPLPLVLCVVERGFDVAHSIPMLWDDDDFMNDDDVSFPFFSRANSSLSASHRMALLINVYNMLVIHAQIEMGAPVGPRARAAFFREAKYW